MNYESLLSFWRSLPHNFNDDVREPIFTFELNNGELWGLYGMSIVGWLEILGLAAVEVLLVALLSTLVYKLIIQKQGTVLAYLVCYGMIIPSLLTVPFSSFSVFGIRNQMIRFLLASLVPITCLFKTTAAAHGCLPSYATTSLKRFALYYASPMPMDWNPKLDKFTPATVAGVLGYLKSFLMMLITLGGMQSLFLLFPGYVPMMGTGTLPPDSDWFHLGKLIYPHKWLVQNLLFAIYFQVKLSAYGAGLVAAQMIVTGIHVRAVMDNPVGSSRSFSEFWGSKWNLCIHDVLKIGVYRPVRARFSREVAMASTFIASGAFHEVLLWVALYPIDNADGCLDDDATTTTISKPECYRPPIFVTTVFFLWQALAVALEYGGVGKWKLWNLLIPDAIIPMLIVILGAPFAHWFVEPYWNSLCFKSSIVLINVIQPVHNMATTATAS